MMINTNNMVSMTEANQNFSKVVRLVDESGKVMILRNNRPRYMVMSSSEYDEMLAERRMLISAITDSVIAENMEALRELAK